MTKFFRFLQVVVLFFAFLYLGGYLLWRGLLLSPFYETSWQLQISEVFWAWFYLPLLPLLLLILLTRGWRALGPLALPLAFFAWEYGAQFLPNWQNGWSAQAIYAQDGGESQEVRGRPLRVMTWNSFRAYKIADDLEMLLRNDSPDIFTIQEVSSGLRRELKNYEEIYPYQYHQSYGSLVTLSQVPLSPPRLDRLYQMGCRCLPLTLEWEGRSLTVINIHLPRPTVSYQFGGGFPKVTRFNPQAQDLHYKVLFNILDEIEGPILLQGDINTTERQPNFLRLTESLKDSFAEAGWGMGFTYPNVSARGPAWLVPLVQIDHILHSQELVALSARVDKLSTSDHLYVAATLRWR